MVERGWKAHVLGEAENTFTDAAEALVKLKARRWLNKRSTDVEPPPPPPPPPPWGGIETQHSTEVESPTPLPRVDMSIHTRGEPCSDLNARACSQ
jgi:hypothetical protein